MDSNNKATKINLLSFRAPHMRSFHMTWLSFFLCFFGWFGISPLMAIVRDDLALTKTQIGDTVIASVFITIFARLVIGWICDRIGPRKAYTILLILGSLPVMLIGLSQDYVQFLLFRLAIGAIGASFVITQYHTSIMFAPNIVGTANATTAGWGNLGGGVTQIVMPLIFAIVVGITSSDVLGWRIAMVLPGIALLLVGIAYYFFTQDAPDGNFDELTRRGGMAPNEAADGATQEVLKDYRVWLLFFAYAACFGIELTVNGVAALYFTDYFGLSIVAAGTVASLFGLMNLFARSAGGILSDRLSKNRGLRGRAIFLFAILFAEGVSLIVFSQITALALAIPMLMLFSLWVQMAEGATYGIVPFINKPALGLVAGIVGAGGNVGAVMAGLLFRFETLAWPLAFLILGCLVTATSFVALAVRFSSAQERAVEDEMSTRLATQPAQ